MSLLVLHNCVRDVGVQLPTVVLVLDTRVDRNV